MPRIKKRNLDVFVPGKNLQRNLNKSIPGTKNFTYSELIYSKTAIQNGIINIPNETQWNRLEDVAKNILQPIRDKFGKVRVNSGYRCVDLCLKIGSSPNSNHTKGYAVDIEVPEKDLAEVVSWIYDNIEFSRMIAEYLPSGWIHIEYDPKKLNKLFMVKDKIRNYTKMEMDDFRKLFNVKQKQSPVSAPPPPSEEKDEKPIENENFVKETPRSRKVKEEVKEENPRGQGPFDNIGNERENQKEDK